MPESIKNVLTRKYGENRSLTSKDFAIGNLKPEDRHLSLGRTNLVLGYPCCALQVTLDFSNAVGLTLVSSCTIYGDEDKPKICGKFPAVKKDFAPCWFDLFKQGIWGLVLRSFPGSAGK